MISPAARPLRPRSPDPGRASHGMIRRWRCRHLVEPELVLGFEGADPLPGVEFAAQGPHHGRLPGALGSGDDDGLLGFDGGGEKGGGDGAEGVELDEVVEADFAEPVPSDHHDRSGCGPGAGGEAGSAVETHVETGLGLAERALVRFAVGGQEGQEVGEFVVGLGDGWSFVQVALGVL